MSQPLVSALHTYPIKSCGGLSHNQVQLEAMGLAHDRRWMVVDERSYQFLTQRELPRMALIQTALEGNQLVLNAPHMPTLRLPQHPTSGIPVDTTVWRNTCRALDVGDDAGDWLSQYLNLSVRLVYMPNDTYRRVNPDYSPQPAQTGFADAYPLLVISEASLEELNRRLTERGKLTLPMNRFRPNLVVSGCEPFAEDTWRKICINGVEFDVVKPCARCAITTVDQAQGAVPDKDEPLATLATFRRGASGGVMFGQNIVHRGLGTLMVGAVVEVM